MEISERLGASDDWREVMAVPFFEGVKVEDYENKKIEPPYKPDFDNEYKVEDYFNVQTDEDNMQDTQIGTI